MTGQKAGNHLEPLTDGEKTRLFREYQRYALVMAGQLNRRCCASGRIPKSTLKT